MIPATEPIKRSRRRIFTVAPVGAGDAVDTVQDASEPFEMATCKKLSIFASGMLCPCNGFPTPCISSDAQDERFGDAQ
jgi:hypothetical protein